MRTMLLILLLTPVLLLCSCDLMESSKIEKAVAKALSDDTRTKEFTFEISHEGEGKVLITGEVYSSEQVNAVKEIAETVEGVSSVMTRIGLEDHSDSGLMQDGVVNTPYF